MQPSYGTIFIVLLLWLQWDSNSTEGKAFNDTSNGNSSLTDSHPSTVQPISQEVILSTATAINPSTTSHAASDTASAKENVTKRTEASSWPDNTVLQSISGTTLSPDVTTVSSDGINNSAANSSRIPTTLPSFTTMGDFSRATESAAAASASTTVPSNSTATHSSAPAVALSSETSASNPTTFFSTSINLTSPTVKQDSPTSNFNLTTEQNQNFSNVSASPHSKDANENKTKKGIVIGGVIIGAILGSILISLIGYFICGKKRSESFSHRRLYDDTRNDPVLHLDKSPYDTSFGCASDDSTGRADKEEDDNPGWPSDGIPMGDMAPSDLSL